MNLVLAAQRGDRRALDDLLRLSLPLVYNVVGRALGGPPDVDDVVQECMLRVVRELPGLDPAVSLRAWLAAIAVDQVGAYRTRAAADRVGPLPEASTAAADFEDWAILRLRLSGQRREVAQAGRWLDADDRLVLSLWWLEVVGEIGRDELAAALGVTIPYAAVRVQRMRAQLEVGRSVVAALAAEPGCADLPAVLAGWDRTPSPLWRKRIVRHVRDCATCQAPSQGRIPAERLLAGCALVPVPGAFDAAVSATGAATGKAGSTQVAAAKAGSAQAGSAQAGSAHAGSAQAGSAKVLMVGRSALTVGGRVAAATVTSVAVAAGAVAYAHFADRRPTQAVAAPLASVTPIRSAAPSVAAASSAPAPSTARPASARVLPTAAHTGCGAGLARAWASWPMPNPKKTGLPHPAHYTDVGDGTVRDDVTCLVWQRAQASRTYTFEQAKSYCADLTLAGGGWHLPSRVELTSLVDSTRSGPAINTAAFPGTSARYFWTSSAWAVTKAPARAWIINFYEGLASNAAWQSEAYQVRCVRSRGGSGAPAYRITGGEVTDPATGLTWQRATSTSTMASAAAPAYCAGLGLGGHTWRLPAMQELATTVDESRVAPAIDTAAFPGTAKKAWYWSASMAAPDPAARWAINYDDGYTSYRPIAAGYVRCVR